MWPFKGGSLFILWACPLVFAEIGGEAILKCLKVIYKARIYTGPKQCNRYTKTLETVTHSAEMSIITIISCSQVQGTSSIII